MKRSSLVAATTLALLMPSAFAASPNDAEEVLMPEVKITGTVPESPHPQDGNYSDRPLGCVEVVTPSGTGNAHGGYFFARFAPSGISVMPNRNDPASASDMRNGHREPEPQAIPPGTSSKPRCS